MIINLKLYAAGKTGNNHLLLIDRSAMLPGEKPFAIIDPMDHTEYALKAEYDDLTEAEIDLRKMTQVMRSLRDGAVLFIPDCQWIDNLKPGDQAPDGFGSWKAVDEIYCREKDKNGKASALVYQIFPNSGVSRISNAYKEDDLVRSTALISLFKSDELNRIEKMLRLEMQ